MTIPTQKPDRKRQFTLRVTLVTAFGSLTLLVGLGLSLITTNLVGRFIQEEFRRRLADSVNIAAGQIDVEMHRQLHSRADESSEAYTALQNQLRQIRARGTNIRFVYTMRQQPDGQVVFVVDAEEREQDFSHIGDVYTAVTPQLLAALSAPPGTRHAFVDEKFYSDEWGTWLSAYAPLYTANGNLEAVLGMDVSAETILAYERQYQVVVWSISLSVTIIVLLLAYHVAQRIRRPLAQLAHEMGKVQLFELDSRPNLSSYILEIDNMFKQLENMKSGLRSFRKYVPADLVRQLVELGVEAELGGAKRDLTIFVSDISGFTTIAERIRPEALVHYLGEYLSLMTKYLLCSQATVDQYLGDGILAFWGAPQPDSDQALNACRAALDCQQAIGELNRQWAAQGLDFAFETRIGIHTGEVIVGNIGAAERMSYTIIGDNVNLTSRLETANKFYGTRILISASTYEQAKEQFVARPIDKVIVVGKSAPICIYELLGENGKTPPELVRLAEEYAQAFQSYQSREFDQALEILSRLRRVYVDDSPTKILLERCKAFLKAPPGPDWDGSTVLSAK